MQNILEQANDIVNKRSEEKERMYGPFGQSMETMCTIFNAMTGLHLETEHMYKAMMAAKLAREAYAHKDDNLLDLAAYTGALSNYVHSKRAATVELIEATCSSCENDTELSHATGLCTQCLLGGGQFRNYCRKAEEPKPVMAAAPKTDRLRISKVRDVKTPTRGTDGSAGLDFYIPEGDNLYSLYPGQDVLIPSGIRVDVPIGYALVAFNKSGIATKKNLMVGACVVDEDYQGEVHIHLRNVGLSTEILAPGDKVVQFLLLPVSKLGVEVVASEDLFAIETERSTNGFGSTGV